MISEVLEIKTKVPHILSDRLQIGWDSNIVITLGLVP